MNPQPATRPRCGDSRALGDGRRLGAGRLPAGALAVAVILALGGCNNSPSDPSVDAFVFTGQLATDGRNVHNFMLPDFELMKIQLSEVRPILYETTTGGTNPVIGVGVGHLDDAGECSATSSGSFREGGFRVFGLTADAYCLAVFDPNTFPEDALVAYTVTVEPE